MANATIHTKTKQNKREIDTKKRLTGLSMQHNKQLLCCFDRAVPLNSDQVDGKACKS